MPRYNRTWLTGDIVAGLSVWALMVPQALGYTAISGVPVQYGLYAAAIALIVYAIFASSHHVVTGPSSTIAAVTGAAVLSERTPINGAVVFTAFGLVLGPLGLGLLTMNVDAEGLSTLAELTLALVLFSDAANANLGELKHSFRIPHRLLLISLPLTILLGGDTISLTVVCTILLSIIGHGLSANPLVAALVARIKRSAGKTAVDE